MTTDITEAPRREMLAQQAQEGPRGRASLAAEFGQLWTTEELQKDFEVIGFMAPIVVVRRRADGKKGSLLFRNTPEGRFYYTWDAHSDK